MNKKILVIGSSNTDMVVKADRFAQPGETLFADQFFMFPGGKGANQAVAAARLGGDVIFVCKVGNDIFGKNAIDGFVNEGIDTRYILKDSQRPSGVALITVNNEGENTILVASGSNFSFDVTDASSILHLLSHADVILMQLELPLNTTEYIINEAKKLNKKIILNPAPVQKLIASIYRDLYLITPNEHEAELLTGIKVVDEYAAHQAAIAFKEKGVMNCIITLGEKGAFAYTDSFKGRINTTKVKAIDTTAAGDVFNGALGVAINNNLDMEAAIRFACNAATTSVKRMGAQASAPYLNELDLIN